MRASRAGNPEAIQLEATRLGLDLSKANIVNPAESPKLKEYSQVCSPPPKVPWPVRLLTRAHVLPCLAPAAAV
jgi:hypothetical protein